VQSKLSKATERKANVAVRTSVLVGDLYSPNQRPAIRKIEDLALAFMDVGIGTLRELKKVLQKTLKQIDKVSSLTFDNTGIDMAPAKKTTKKKPAKKRTSARAKTSSSSKAKKKKKPTKKKATAKRKSAKKRPSARKKPATKRKKVKSKASPKKRATAAKRKPVTRRRAA